MSLTLVIPGLLDRWKSSAGVKVPLPDAPSLARLLRIAPKPRIEPEGLFAALAPIYGVSRQRDWPVAPLLVRAHGVDVGDHYWLAATPVAMTVGREDVRISGAAENLDADDARVLIDCLNAHFAADGLHFVALSPCAWFVQVDPQPALMTRPLSMVTDKALRPLLPTGEDAPLWRRWEHEIQMLLFEHPVNEARERRGDAPVSSVWFDGGGHRPPSPQPMHRRIATFGLSEVADALAHHIEQRVQPLPANFATAIAPEAGAEHGRATVVFAGDFDLERFDARIAEPAWRALMRGDIADITVIADGAGDGALVWCAPRPSLAARLLARRAPPPVERLIAQSLPKADP